MSLLAAHARTLLFLPADRLERLDKALGSGTHMVILDLEDAVSPDARASARTALQERWALLDPSSRGRIAIRINAANTEWHGDDCALVETLARDSLGAVMLAKTESASQLRVLASYAGQVALLPLVESAEGWAGLELIARAPGVARLAFGHLDFQVDLGMQCGPDERELDPVRLDFVSVSRRAGLPGPIDGVTTNLQDPAQVEDDTRRSLRFGFTGKLCIHPAQVPVVNASLAPTDVQVAWARRVLAAANSQSAGAFQFDGAMVDAPVLARARRYLQAFQ